MPKVNLWRLSGLSWNSRSDHWIRNWRGGANATVGVVVPRNVELPSISAAPVGRRSWTLGCAAFGSLDYKAISLYRKAYQGGSKGSCHDLKWLNQNP
jgi:hypothetical protein